MGCYDKEWNLVQRRKKLKRQKADVFCEDWWRKNFGKDEVVTYFFSKFPDNFGAREMLRSFASYGGVVDVVISSKWDKTGRRFGFARFVGVANSKLFGTKLDNIIIGATNLNVNFPRFQRVNDQEKDFKQQLVREKEHAVNEIGNAKQQHLVWREKNQDAHHEDKGEQRKSYAEVVGDSKGRRVVDEEENEDMKTTKSKVNIARSNDAYRERDRAKTHHPRDNHDRWNHRKKSQ